MTIKTVPHPRDSEERRQGSQSINGLRQEGEVVGTSALAQAARQSVAHFLARDASSAAGTTRDSIEVWGRRIGRALSLAGVIALGVYLYATYLH
jgi:hypothetical protein